MLVRPAQSISRFKFAFVAAVFAFGALYVQHTGILPSHGEYTASIVLECGLLPDVVTLGALRAKIEAPRFEGALDAPAELDSVPGYPSQIRLASSHSIAEVAESARDQARSLLAAELKSLATRELELSRKHLQSLSEDHHARQLRPESAEISNALPENGSSSLTAEENRRVLKLQRENEALDQFLTGGYYPAWLKTKLEGNELKRLSRQIAQDEAELHRLKQTWSDDSKVVLAQAMLVEESNQERRRVRRELARVLLRANKLELESLEAKNLAIVQDRLETKKEPVQEKPSGKATSDFLERRAEELSEKARQQEALASLEPVSPPELTQVQAAGYWVVLGLWAGALCSLLAALFVGSKGSHRLGERPFLRAAVQAQQAPSATPTRSVGAPLEPQMILSDLYEKLNKNLGREPKRLLILGNEKNLARSSFTLRLANTLGKTKRRVRLVDFDLPEKELSNRFAADQTPGVSDILTYGGGAVEEFFASLPGTNIEFAAAGSKRVLHEPICSATLDSLLNGPEAGVTLVDASFNSPLHLLVGHIDAVLCLTEPGVEWKTQEEQILLAFREAKLPLWGVARGGSQIFPFI